MSDNMNLVSIIIPCFNYGWIISETLDSVLRQSYPNWECIIIDDGSTDNTRKIVEKYKEVDSRFIYVYQENGGMSSARNNALQIARGEYIQFLDADDLLAPKKLAFQVAYLNQHFNVDVVYGDMRYFKHESPHIISRSYDMLDSPWHRRILGQGEDVLMQLIDYNDIVINTPLVRNRLIKKIGLFAAELRSMEDWEFWVRCAMHGANFDFYDAGPDSWAWVRIHPNSTSQNRNRMLDYTCKARSALHDSLLKIGAYRAAKINHDNLIAAHEELAFSDFLVGKPWNGFQKFWYLAKITGRYLYYAKSGLYWFRRNINIFFK